MLCVEPIEQTKTMSLFSFEKLHDKNMSLISLGIVPFIIKMTKKEFFKNAIQCNSLSL